MNALVLGLIIPLSCQHHGGVCGDQTRKRWVRGCSSFTVHPKILAAEPTLNALFDPIALGLLRIPLDNMVV